MQTPSGSRSPAGTANCRSVYPVLWCEAAPVIRERDAQTDGKEVAHAVRSVPGPRRLPRGIDRDVRE